MSDLSYRDLTPEEQERLERILTGAPAEQDMSHMTCYTCGNDLSEIDPMTVTAQWDGDVLYLTFECHCEAGFEIRLTPDVLRDTLEHLTCL
jgi:hypothetical protein